LLPDLSGCFPSANEVFPTSILFEKLIEVTDILNIGWIVLQFLAMIVFFFWLTCANEGWGLFLGFELVALVLLFVAWVGLDVIGIDINDHQWIIGALVSWPLVAMLAFQLASTYKKVRSRLHKNANLPSNEPRVLPENVAGESEMRPMPASVYKIVERAALVCRKYTLLNAEGFVREFQGIDDLVVSSAWTNALDKVRDHEVIEVSPRREITQFIGDSLIAEVVSKPEYENDEANFAYLMGKFDDSQLDVIEEHREREIRRLLALRYITRSRGAALGNNHELLGSFVVRKNHFRKKGNDK
jgi:hypothetical protein